ncbi:MAG: hypothetical protein VX464_07805 [Pseudomonadota bacterium]|nr:hypothetical protein [Pseudomonadota bacterium]
MSSVPSAFPAAEIDITAFDPGQSLSALYMAEEPLPRGAAEGAILSWLLALPDGTDPARAAQILREMSPFSDASGGEAGKASELLRQIAQFPAERLARPRRRRVRN